MGHGLWAMAYGLYTRGLQLELQFELQFEAIGAYELGAGYPVGERRHE